MTSRPRVLVTRPGGQCDALCDALADAGFDARAVPVIDIVPVHDPAGLRDAFAQLDDTQLLIFISRNAVTHALASLPDPDRLRARVAAVGPATARALIDAKWRCDVAPEAGFTSEALLAHPALQDVAGQRVLIVRGEGGRPLLGDTLRQRGAQVHYAEVYRRDIPADAAGRLNNELAMGVDAMTATSVETLSNIESLTRPEHVDLLHDVKIVTASERVLKKAGLLGYTRAVVLATAPDDAALVQALVHWRDALAAGEPETFSMATNTNDPTNESGRDGDDAELRDDASFDTTPDHDATDMDASTEADPASSFEDQGVGDDASDTEETTDADPDAPRLADDGEPAVSDTPAPAAPPQPAAESSSGGGGRGLAAAALLVALGAGGLGFMANKTAKEATENREDPRVALNEVADGLRGDIETIRDEVNTTAESLRGDVSSAAESLRGDVDRKLGRIDLDPINKDVDELTSGQASLDRRLTGQRRALDTVTDRLGDMESDLAALQGVSDTVRNTWVRAEAEYFLQTANSRLQLASDVISALSALRAADERIGALGDPGLIPIRAKITEEILAVEAVPLPDIEGTALTLLGMTERIADLPLRADDIPQRFDAHESADGTVAESGWERAWTKVSGAFTGIVRISPSDGSGVDVVAPEDAYFIFRNLELNLTIARLALMRGDQANYTGSLEAAYEWLGVHFDTQEPGVSNMMTRLAEMKDLEIDPELPDISESLRMLRVLVKQSSSS